MPLDPMTPIEPADWKRRLSSRYPSAARSVISATLGSGAACSPTRRHHTDAASGTRRAIVGNLRRGRRAVRVVAPRASEKSRAAKNASPVVLVCTSLGTYSLVGRTRTSACNLKRALIAGEIRQGQGSPPGEPHAHALVHVHVRMSMSMSHVPCHHVHAHDIYMCMS